MAIAQDLLISGKLTIEDIAKVTGLAINEAERLKK